MYKIRVLLFVLCLSISLCSSSEPFGYKAEIKIQVENDDFLIIHEHKADPANIFYSLLRVIEKSNNKEIKYYDVAPLINLIPLNNGEFFVGLSVLKHLAMPYGYNFVMLNSEGEIIAQDFINSSSGHCDEVSESRTSWIYWYDYKNPEIDVDYIDGVPARVKVMNPHDEVNSGICVIEIADK